MNNLWELLEEIDRLFERLQMELLPYVNNNIVEEFLKRKENDIKDFKEMVLRSEMTTVPGMINWLHEINAASKWFGICMNTTSYFSITDEIAVIVSHIDDEEYKKAKEEENERREDPAYRIDEDEEED